MELKDDHWEELYVFAKELAERGVDFEEIEKRLAAKSPDPVVASEIVQQLKKVRCAVQRKNGLAKVGFGCLLLLIGFFITCVNFHSNQSFTIVMYSTSIGGLALVFLGLYEILG